MTEDNKRTNIEREVAKAEHEFQAARLVHEGELFDAAVGHAYYAAFHYARALLLMEGLEAKSHDGVQHLVRMNFVRTGRLDNELMLNFTHLQKDREISDYDAAAEFSNSMASRAMLHAREFADACRKLLIENGYLQVV